MNTLNRIKQLQFQCIEDLKNCTDTKELVWCLSYYHKRIRFQNTLLKIQEKSQQVWNKTVAALNCI